MSSLTLNLRGYPCIWMWMRCGLVRFWPQNVHKLKNHDLDQFSLNPKLIAYVNETTQFNDLFGLIGFHS